MCSQLNVTWVCLPREISVWTKGLHPKCPFAGPHFGALPVTGTLIPRQLCPQGTSSGQAQGSLLPLPPVSRALVCSPQ